MELHVLGKSGLKVSAIGLGCNNFGRRIEFEASRKVIHQALDLGITLFDTADVYGNGYSEDTLGRCLGERRKDIVLATKFGLEMGASRRHIMLAAEASLRRLKTEWIDLYWVHRPDPATPIEETLRALDDLIRQGKIRYIGCSNFAAWKVVEAQWTSRHHNLHSFIACQDEYSLLRRGMEASLEPAMRAYGLGLIPYYPLASGMLTGKYKRHMPLPEDARISKHKKHTDRWLNSATFDIVERLESFSRQRGHSLLELAMNWLASHSLVSAIIVGATKPEQVELNVRSLGWTLTADEMKEIDSLTRPS